MTLNQSIEFPKRVDRTRWILVPEVIDEATEIATSTRDDRSFKEKYEDALNGVSLQYAVGYSLAEAGHTVRLAPIEDKSFDFEIDAVRFDVKGIFKYIARAYKQTTWEHDHALTTTIYICYNCKGDTCDYAGWCRHGDFELSNFDGYRIYWDRLKHGKY
jgi:hypothetical protein